MVGARLRPFAQTDWELLSALARTQPVGDRQEGETWLDDRRQFDETRYVRRHYVAEHAETGQALGYGAVEQSVYDRGTGCIGGRPASPARRRRRLLVERLTADLREVNAVTVSLRGDASRPDLLALLEEHGFVETSRVLDLRLKVSDEASRRSRLSPKVCPARCAYHDPRRGARARPAAHLEKLYELRCAAELDDPTRTPLGRRPSTARRPRSGCVCPTSCPTPTSSPPTTTNTSACAT